MPDVETIAFVGAGNMGRPMIRHLLGAGHRVVVAVRRPEARAAIAEMGAGVAVSPAAAAWDASFVFTNVTSTADVEEVLFGPEGAVQTAGAGTTCIDFSTICPIATRRIAARLEEKGLAMLDAPVSGGVVGAEAASLSIMVGGRPEVLARAEPLLRLLGRVVTHVGASGAGQVAKACNQIVQVVNIEGIAEAMYLCSALGVEPGKVLPAIAAGMAGSRMLDLMGPRMVARNFVAGIEARLHAKDFGLVQDVAQEAGLELPAVERVRGQLERLLQQGWGRDDTSSLLRVLEAERPAARGHGEGAAT
jgi:3-hydroxyisobutyrate dehydrogenase-like beta-hydroxyacid dehydrogenase